MKTKLLGLLLVSFTSSAFAQTTAQEYFDRGRSSLSNKSDEIDAAIADLSMAIKLKPDYHEAYNMRGILKTNNKGDLDGALADYTKAIELNPNPSSYSTYYTNRADIRAKLKDFTGALADCDKAIELSPKNHRHYHTRGKIRLTQKNYSGAIADFTKALEIKSDYFAVLNSRAEAYRALGQTSLAEEDEKKYEAEAKKLMDMLEALKSSLKS